MTKNDHTITIGGQVIALTLIHNHPIEMHVNNTAKDSISKVVVLLNSLLWGGDQCYIQSDEANHMTLSGGESCSRSSHFFSSMCQLMLNWPFSHR